MITLTTNTAVSVTDMSDSPARSSSIDVIVKMTISDYFLRSKADLNSFTANYKYTYENEGETFTLLTKNNDTFYIPDSTDNPDYVRELSTLIWSSLPDFNNVVDCLKLHVITIAKNEMAELYGISTDDITVL